MFTVHILFISENSQKNGKFRGWVGIVLLNTLLTEPKKKTTKVTILFFSYKFQVVNSSKTTSSTLTSHATSSQYHITSEMKAQALKRDLSEIKNSMSEINNLASMGRSTQQSSSAISSNSAMSKLQERYIGFSFLMHILFENVFFSRAHTEYDLHLRIWLTVPTTSRS